MRTFLIVLLLTSAAAAQVNTAVSPVPRFQFISSNGQPLAGACLFSYVTGTSTPLATYTDNTGTVTNANPVILDASGSANVWLGPQKYRLQLFTSGGINCVSGAQIWQIDGVSGNNVINSTTISLAAQTAPTCVATQYILWADSSANRWKMCNNGVIDTIIGAATTDALTNKTLTSPTINGGALSASTLTGATALNGTNTFGGTATFNAATTFTSTGTHSGAETFNGSVTATSTLNASGASNTGFLNGIYFPAMCGSAAVPSWCAGSDMGGWINAAYAALTSAGGEIDIPAGSFSFSTPIVLNTIHKPIRLHGAGNSATTLTYTATTGTAITIDTGVNDFSSELDHFKLVGSGVGNATTGVSWGATNASTAASADFVQVTGFGTGMAFPATQDFIWTGFRVFLSNNGQNLLDTSGGQEDNRCFSCVFSLDTPGTTGTTANSVAIGNSADWYMFGCSFDNVQLAVTTNALVRVFGGHFENPAQTSYDFFTSSGNDVEFHGTNFNQDNGSTFPNGRFGSASVGKVAIYGGTAFSPITLTTFVALSGTASASNDSLTLNSTFSSGWVTNVGSGYAAGFAQDGSGNTVIQNVTQSGTLRTNALTMGNSSPELLCSATAPTISSGFNAGTVGASANGTCSFFVNVGTGTAGSTGVLTLPTATSGWTCWAQNQARAALVLQTANSTTSATLTNYGTTFAATNWTNSDPILISCFGR